MRASSSPSTRNKRCLPLPVCSVIRLRMLLQWMGTPFSLERGCPGKTDKINGFWELVLCLCYRKIGAMLEFAMQANVLCVPKIRFCNGEHVIVAPLARGAACRRALEDQL